MSQIRAFTFIGGDSGSWRVTRNVAAAGEALGQAARISVVSDLIVALPHGASWLLRGVTSHERYATRQEHDDLARQSPPLGRAEATCAALIPIRKSPAWWSLAQDERRALVEERSEHIKIGMEYLPAVARRLHHSRELGEPFDFLTWFEYAPEASEAFEELVGRLRRREEWKFVEREIDIRLIRES